MVPGGCRVSPFSSRYRHLIEVSLQQKKGYLQGAGPVSMPDTFGLPTADLIDDIGGTLHGP